MSTHGAFVLVLVVMVLLILVALAFHRTAARDPTQHAYRKWLGKSAHMKPGELRADGNYRMAFARIREIASEAVMKRPSDGLRICMETWKAEIDKLAKFDPDTARLLESQLPCLWTRDLLLPDAYDAWWLHRTSPTRHLRSAFRD